MPFAFTEGCSEPRLVKSVRVVSFPWLKYPIPLTLRLMLQTYLVVESDDLDKDKAGLTSQSGWHSPQDHEVCMEAFHMLSVIASCGRLPLKLFQVGRLDGKGGYES